MTESEFLLVKNLANLQNALSALEDIFPGGIIEEAELREVIEKLSRWKIDHYVMIKLDES